MKVGFIKGAIDIPYADWDAKITSLPATKETPIVVYSMSSINEVFEAAKKNFQKAIRT
jgi:hypothetical protein